MDTLISSVLLRIRNVNITRKQTD